MNKLVLIGDPHAKINNLPQLEKVVDLAIANKGGATHAVLLGDLFDTHAVVRNEISYFWRDQLSKLMGSFEYVIAIVGNHDQAGNVEKEHVHSLWAYESLGENLVVVDKPTGLDIGLFLPYTSSEEKFISWCEEGRKNGHKVVFCHQTFDGAKYDNGMYAPDGFSLDKISDLKIISGHIHTQSEFGNVWYPGTAMWESASDANKDKGVWRVSIGSNGVQEREFISSETVIPKMVSIVVNEGDDHKKLDDNKKYLVHLVGNSKWIAKAKKEYVGHKVKTTFTDSTERKSQKQNQSGNLSDFLSKKNFKTPVQDLLRYIRSL